MKIINVKSPKTTFRFKLSDKALYIAPRKQEKRRICGWVKIAGLATFEGSKKLFVVINVKDEAGAVQHLYINRGEFRRKDKTMAFLAEHWRDCPHREDEDALFAYLTSFNPKQTIILMPRTGWLEKAYVFPEKVIGESSLTPHYLPSEEATTRSSGCSGSLAAWKDGVARLAKCSDRLTFCLSASFAALILKHINGEGSCTFHLFANSGNGKTTAQIAAQSIHGLAKRDELPHWGATQVRLDELAAEHCDRVLVLDEIVRLGSTDRQIAERAQAASYKFASGVGKLRSVHYGKAGNPTSWRTIVISSGEFSLHEKAEAIGKDRLRGDLVRLIDVPATASKEHGIFNKVPAKMKNSAEAVAALEDAASSNYGYPSRAFVRAFAANVPVNAAAIEADIRAFLKKAKVPADKWEQRFARKFAIVYAAGTFAVGCKLVPWSTNWVFKSVRRCYRMARGSIPDHEALVKGAMLAIHRELAKPSVVVDLDQGKAKAQAIAEAGAFLKTDPKKGAYFAVRPEVAQTWIGDKVSLPMVLQQLDKDKLLLKTQSNVMTKPVLIKGIKGKRRYLCILRKEFLSAYK